MRFFKHGISFAKTNDRLLAVGLTASPGLRLGRLGCQTFLNTQTIFLDRQGCLSYIQWTDILGLEVTNMINIGGRHFYGPYQLNDWAAPAESGVYAILTGTGVMVNQDELLYIGISRNFSDGRIGPMHYAYRSWMENSEPHGNLYVAVYPMPYSSELLLALEEEKLVKLMNPLCNQLHSPIMKALFR